MPTQSAEEVIFSLPNGLQGYVLFGAWNQRRVDAFTNIVRDPRITRNATDTMLDNLTGFGRTAGIEDHRLNTGSSCIGCHIDRMNRSNNKLRDWLDEGGGRLPKGPSGVDGWVNDADTVARVRELYPPSSKMRVTMENDRRIYLNAMVQIQQGMILGVALLMKTDAFEDGGIIPERYSGRGGNVRPGFTFSNVPEGTVSFAIVLQDLDVAANGLDGVLHWLAWNIPAKAGGIPEGVLPEGSVVGTANVGRGTYFGPGAPAGPRYHHYVFEIYALNAMLDLPANATRAQLLDAMKDIIVGKAAHFGRFRQ